MRPARRSTSSILQRCVVRAALIRSVSDGLPTRRSNRRHRHRSLEFGNPLQRRPSQPLRIPRDLTLALALEAGYAAIEGSDELEQIVKERLLRSGWHRHGVSFREKVLGVRTTGAENSVQW
jgi:hypothetical protein